jgi:hypothetical protein
MESDPTPKLALTLLTLGVVTVGSIFWNLNWLALIVVAITSVLLRLTITDWRDVLLLGFASFAWTTAVQAGFIQFSLFEQARSLLDRNIDPVDLLWALDLWGPRYLITYPAVWLADEWQVELDVAFTYFGSALLALETFFLAKLTDASLGDARFSTTKFFLIVVFAIWVIGIATAMNGRLAAAHLGIAIVLYAQVRAVDSQAVSLSIWVLHAIGLFLTLMTSGTAMVGFTQVAVAPIVLRRIRTNSLRDRLLDILPVVPVLIVAFPIIRAGISKNMEYWGSGLGALVNMLEHGWGELLTSVPAVGIFVVVAGMLYLRFALVEIRRNSRVMPLILNVPIAVTCGIYGYSTLTMSLPAIGSLLVVSAVQRLRVRMVSRAPMLARSAHGV